jgi:hypothetical protein
MHFLCRLPLGLVLAVGKSGVENPHIAERDIARNYVKLAVGAVFNFLKAANVDFVCGVQVRKDFAGQ